MLSLPIFYIFIMKIKQAENMSYFKCEHGSKYFPFGKGGRKNLLRSLRLLDDDTDNSSESGTAAVKPVRDALYRRLLECPMHRLPLLIPPDSRDQQSNDEEDNISDIEVNDISGEDDDTVSDISSIDEEVVMVRALRQQQQQVLGDSKTGVQSDVIEAASVFTALAQDVITEIFKIQVGAVLVRALFYLLYYYT